MCIVHAALKILCQPWSFQSCTSRLDSACEELFKVLPGNMLNISVVFHGKSEPQEHILPIENDENDMFATKIHKVHPWAL